jgi:hypothetical protein
MGDRVIQNAEFRMQNEEWRMQASCVWGQAVALFVPMRTLNVCILNSAF